MNSTTDDDNLIHFLFASLEDAYLRCMKKLTITLLFVGLVIGCATTDGALAEIADAEPTPELSPQEVVELQLAAFRGNGEEDRGIGIAFRFASPRNRLSTGPVERFAQMMRGPAYSAMLGYESAEYAETVVRGRVAMQRVRLLFDDEIVTYDFFLIRQEGGRYDGCWMTEAVYVVGPDGESSQGLNV